MKVSLLLLFVASLASADFVDEPIDGKDVGDVPGVEDVQDMQAAGFSQVIASCEEGPSNLHCQILQTRPE